MFHNVNLLFDSQAMCLQLICLDSFSQFRSMFLQAIKTVTLGRGERSCATCRSATRGIVRRLGRTRWEAIASIIIVSDMALQMNARMMMETHRRHTDKQTKSIYYC